MTGKQKIILLSISLVGFLLRFVAIDQFPHGFNADEAANGYNAYSLLLTGKDEHGTGWPVHFKSFADYKPGGMVYTILPLLKFLGLSEVVVRLPSVVAGSLAVYLVFYLSWFIFRNFKVSVLAAIMLAISPWQDRKSVV